MPLDRADSRRASWQQRPHPEPGDLIDLRTPQPKRPGRRRPEDHFPEARRWSTRGTKDSRGAYVRALRNRAGPDAIESGMDEPERRGVWTTETSKGGPDWAPSGTDPGQSEEREGWPPPSGLEWRRLEPHHRGAEVGDGEDGDDMTSSAFRRSVSARGWLEGRGRSAPSAGIAGFGQHARILWPRFGGSAVKSMDVEADAEGCAATPSDECNPCVDEENVESGESDVIEEEDAGRPEEEGGRQIGEEGIRVEEDTRVEEDPERIAPSSSNSLSDADDQPDWSWIEELAASSAPDGPPADSSTSFPRGGYPPSAPPASLVEEEEEEEWEERRERRHLSASPHRRMRATPLASVAFSSLHATLPRSDQVGGGIWSHAPTGRVDEEPMTTVEVSGPGGGDEASTTETQLRRSRASMRRVEPFRLSSRRMVHSAPEAATEGEDYPPQENGDVEGVPRPDGQSIDDAESVPVLQGGGGSGGGGEGSCGARNSAGGDESSSSASVGPSLMRSPFGPWPHNFSSLFACLGCTVGLFNISRFAILSIHFGATFIIQFIILSLIFGIPLYAFHISIGQYLGSGVIDMWRISPVFQGIGVALLASQALLGIYSIVGVSWMFVYFRDSFITKQDAYRWAEPFELYREGNPVIHNGTFKLEETVPDYFSGVVLQRHNLKTSETSSFGHLKFQLVFNLAVVWMIIFVCLCKGLKSYGKVVYVFVPLSILCIIVVSTKMLGIIPFGDPRHIFHETVWSEFFLNNKSWLAAATEAFFTWGLLGASAMQITSHNAGVGTEPGSKRKSTLHRDTLMVVLMTFAILLLSAFLGNACARLLHIKGGYEYVPSSFEEMSSYTFLWPLEVSNHHLDDSPTIPPLPTTPTRYMTHVPLLAGVQIAIPWAPVNFDWSHSREMEFLREMASIGRSGYQSLRLATELAPGAFAFLGSTQLSPFWAVLFYFTLILFGIAQQLAIWHCVVTGITAINAKKLKAWETTITFFACAFGFVLGLPMTTELGIFTVHFLDYCIGCGWWLMILYLAELGSVLVIRGRPYSGENVVTALFPSLRRMQQNNGTDDRHARNQPQPTCLATWAAPTLAFAWNAMLPVALLVLAITVFKNGNLRCLYNWSVVNNSGSNHRGFDDPFIFLRGEDFEHTVNHAYWPVWARQVGSFLQIIPILSIPVIALIQAIRYLSSGSPDLFERIEALYRPHPNTNRYADYPQGVSSNRTGNTTRSGGASAGRDGNPSGSANEMGLNNFEDPPPKYTPPPSYTTATGARIAKLLRQSFRRSMRRLTTVLGETSNSRADVAVAARQDDCADGTTWSTSISGHHVQNRLSLLPVPSCASREQESENSASSLPPPDYATVLIEIRQSLQQNLQQENTIPTNEDVAGYSNECTAELQRPAMIAGANDIMHQTDQNRLSTATAERVATLLRSSGRRPHRGRSNPSPDAPTTTAHTSASSSSNPSSWRSSFRSSTGLSGSNAATGARPSESVECLVEKAVPIHEESSNADADIRDNGGELNFGLSVQGIISSAM